MNGRSHATFVALLPPPPPLPGGIAILRQLPGSGRLHARCCLIATLILGIPLPALAAAVTYAPGKVVIRVSPAIGASALHDWTGDAALDAALRSAGAVSARRLIPHPTALAHPTARPAALDRYWRVRFDGPRDPEDFARLLSTLPGIELAEAVPVCRVTAVPDDPSFTSQWAFSTANGHGIAAPTAWDTATGDSSVAIGVLDTGVDWQHPDLGGAAPYTGGNIWTNWAEANGLPGVDDDGDGYIDDIRGWDFVDNVPVYPGEDGSTPDNDPSDFDGHGTHVSGIMAALTDNATGVAGVTWRCKLMPLRMGYAGTDPYTGNEVAYVQMDFAAEAMTYAADHGVAAANCSWSSNSFSAFATAVDYAVASGIAVVDAAGNTGSDSQLGNYLSQRGDCFDVAAVDSLDQRAAFSSYGAWVDISAPGLVVLSTFFDRASGAHGYATLSGTSQAAPFVTAAAALWRSVHPADSLEAFRHRLAGTAASIDDFNTPDVRGKLGAGRLDLGALLGASTSWWQAPTTDSVVASVAIGDLGPNKRGAVVAVSANGVVFALGRSGVMLPGWPVVTRGAGGSYTPPAIAPKLGAGAGVVVASGDGTVRAWDADANPLGGQWPRRLDGAIRGGVSCGAILPGSASAVLAGTEAGSVFALDSLGADLPNWPVHPSSPVRGAPALVDLTGNGLRNVVAATTGGCVYAWDGATAAAVPGWPVCTGGIPITQPVAAGTAGNLGYTVVAAVTDDNRLFVWNRSGVLKSGWPVQLPGSALPAAPVLADLTPDPQFEVVAATGTKVLAFRNSGLLLPGWPQTLPARAAAAPLIADIDDDGANDVIVACADGRVYAFAASGAAIPGWPRAATAGFEGAPAIGDAGGDGIPDLVAGSDDGWLYAWPLPGGVRGPDRLQWPMFGHDASRGSRHTAPNETAAEIPVTANGALVLRAEEAHGGRTLRLAWSQQLAASGRLELFDIAGRAVASRLLTRDDLARRSVAWEFAPRPLAAGLYFARLRAGETRATARLLVLP